MVQRDGPVLINGSKYQVSRGMAGTTVTMRLDKHLMGDIADGVSLAPDAARHHRTDLQAYGPRPPS